MKIVGQIISIRAATIFLPTISAFPKPPALPVFRKLHYLLRENLWCLMFAYGKTHGAQALRGPCKHRYQRVTQLPTFVTPLVSPNDLHNYRYSEEVFTLVA